MKRIVASIGMLAASYAMAAETLVDEIELTKNTNIVVAAGDTLKVDYLWASASCVLTKSGAGTLVLATVGTNVFVDVQAGTLASARQLVSPKFADNPQSVRIDCNDRSKMTINGVGKVSAIKDADTNVQKCSDWSMGLPHVSDETQNG